MAKLFTELIVNKLQEWIENNNILPEFQAGFRKSYYTIDNILTLMSNVKIHLNRNHNKVYAFFNDLSAAFDRLYSETVASVWCGRGLSESFEAKIGLK